MNNLIFRAYNIDVATFSGGKGDSLPPCHINLSNASTNNEVRNDNSSKSKRNFWL